MTAKGKWNFGYRLSVMLLGTATLCGLLLVPTARAQRYDQRDRGYQDYGYQGGATMSVDTNNNVNWQGPQNAQIFVSEDNGPFRLFASGPSGRQSASWISAGHDYVFQMRDANGNVLTQQDVNLSAPYQNQNQNYQAPYNNDEYRNNDQYRNNDRYNNDYENNDRYNNR